VRGVRGVICGVRGDERSDDEDVDMARGDVADATDDEDIDIDVIESEDVARNIALGLAFYTRTLDK